MRFCIIGIIYFWHVGISNQLTRRAPTVIPLFVKKHSTGNNSCTVLCTVEANTGDSHSLTHSAQRKH